ncbi:hypothetical protein BVG19_g4689 [[Candida] boidinii]|nr:hypothetical protein BVG19_g4689 [[Candida] boidinii]OWB53337.1 hydrolase activity protein [[Candida] boidinii]
MSRAIASDKVVINNSVIPATVIFSIESGKILEIIENEILDPTDKILINYAVSIENYRNVSPLMILPGLVDSHVHLNEPGRTDWEGFATGTQSAASGGVTTVIDMPLNAIPPTTTLSNFYAKIDAAKGQTWCDVGFWGGLVPDNLDNLIPLINAGVRGFKGFLMDSGVEEFPMITPDYITQALSKVKGYNTMLMFHAEMEPLSNDAFDKDESINCCSHNHTTHNHSSNNASQIEELDLGLTKTTTLTNEQIKSLARSPILSAVEPKVGKISELIKSPNLNPSSLDNIIDNEEEIDDIDNLLSSPLLKAAEEDEILKGVDPKDYTSFLASRPDLFEVTAIESIIACSKLQPTTPIHIVHLASEKAIPIIQEAKFTDNLPITVETCFHYLTFKSEEIPKGATQFKCCPPIRTEENRVQLWQGLKSGIITSVVSDHSPCTPELKGLERGDFFAAWGGITSVGFGLPLLWTQADFFKITILDIVKWCCENTSKQVGLDYKKGKIAIGFDADFAIFDPDMKYKINNNRTFFKNKLTAFHDMDIKGKVVETILRGNSIYALGKGLSDIPMGNLILERRF